MSPGGTRSEAKSQECYQCAMWVAGAQVLRPSWDAFPGALGGRRIRSRAVSLTTGTLLQDTSKASGRFSHCATPAPNLRIFFFLTLLVPPRTKRCCFFLLSNSHYFDFTKIVKGLTDKNDEFRVERRRGREKNMFYPLVQFPNICNGQNWVDLKQGDTSQCQNITQSLLYHDTTPLNSHFRQSV